MTVFAHYNAAMVSALYNLPILATPSIIFLHLCYLFDSIKLFNFFLVLTYQESEKELDDKISKLHQLVAPFGKVCFK